MKKYKYTRLVVILVLIMGSCAQEESIGSSQIDTNKPITTALDDYIRSEYIGPYNIDVLYRWNENVVDLDRYLVPPRENQVRPVLELVKKIWIDSYNETGGDDFVKLIAPRELLLVGNVNLNESATRILGVAEGGKRIVLFETDLLDLKNKNSVITFVETIQHEYAHILNQTEPFDEQGYGKITPTEYTAQWFNTSNRDARELGFISAYARANVGEDFAEMVNAMLSNSGKEYNELVNSIANEEARNSIRAKEAIVVDYYIKKFGIDFYALQDITARNVAEIFN